MNIWSLLKLVRRKSKSYGSRKLRRRVLNAGSRLESLEDRVLLSDYYNLATVASTSEGTFTSFGDLVSTNNSGDIAFVGFTDEGSGLWVADRSGGLTNINPSFSHSPDRDFGRAAEINNNGIVVARDRASGAPAGYFIRAWFPGTPDDHVIRASANNFLQPDFGQYSALQTFADINDNGDIAFVALSADGNSRLLMFQPAGTSMARIVNSYPPTEIVSRPQITNGGQVLQRLGDNALVLVNPYSNQFEVVANGFTEMGYAPGMSDNGKIVTFIGNRGNGRGVFVAYKTDSGYEVTSIAGEGADGWIKDSFDLTDAVRVNNTLVAEHGVTVAFEADHPIAGHGIYSVRVSFFGSNAAANFATSNPHSAIASGAMPVLTDQEMWRGSTVADVEFWNGVDDVNRGEIVFWAKLGNGVQEVIRATSTPIVWVDFNPETSPIVASGTLQNQLLLKEVGVVESGWIADFDQALINGGLSPDTNFFQLQTQVVNAVQQYFTDALVNVRVLGRSTDVLPAFVGRTVQEVIPGIGGGMVNRGAFMTVQVGGAPSSVEANLFGQASGPFVLPNGDSTRDYFNQTQDDVAVVFADHILAYLGGSPSVSALTTAVARTIAHEAAHNLGLVHLDTGSNQDLMNTTIELPSELTSSFQGFRDVSIATEEFPGITENSRRRLWFAAGGPAPGSPPSSAILNSGIQSSLYSLAASISTPIMVQKVIVGIIEDDDTMPTYFNLGGGNLADVLADSRLPVQDGNKFVILGSTDGTTLDIVGAVPGQQAVLDSLDISQLGLSTNVKLQAIAGSAPTLNLFRLTNLGPVALGSASITGIPVIEVGSGSSSLASGDAIGLGETTPGGGDLTKVLIIQNTGTEDLNLGGVAITGAGYTVGQPGSSVLAPGQSTTIQVTLSDVTAGIGLSGTLTIPSNDPTGSFILTVRGTVDGRPRVLGVTRIDNGTGPVRVEIQISGQLQPEPAAIANNFAIVSDTGATLLIASAVYSETNGQGRIVLTTVLNGSDLRSGSYKVRMDGTQVLTLTGAPLATTCVNLLSHQIWDDLTLVTIGADGDAGATILAGPIPTGFSPPKNIVQSDFNYDGIQDFVATSEYTGELVFHWGQAEGGYLTQAMPIDSPTSSIIALPQSILAADWNQDGFSDLVVFDTANDGVQGLYRILVLLNDGQGNFAAAPDTPIPIDQDLSGPLLTVGDFTGDGSPEIAIVGSFISQGSIVIYGKDPFLGYSQLALISTEHAGWYPESIVSADLNGDGRMDLVVPTIGNGNSNTRPVVYLNTPTGLALQADLEYSGESGNVAVGDFSGDGMVDIAVINDNYSNNAGVNEGGVISLLVGNGQGGFAARPNVILGRRGVSLAASGDVNQDGILDLILRADPFIQNGFDPTTELSLWTLLGREFGEFDLSAELVPFEPTGNLNPGNFILRDLTGDGYPDLSFGNLATGHIGLFINDGAGLLTASQIGPLTATNTAFHSQVTSEPGIVIADLNRDGFPDQLRIVSDVGGFSLQAIDVLWGNAAGQFEIVSSIYVSRNEYSPHDQNMGTIGFLKVGDLNNDGWLDLIIGTDSGLGGPLQIHLGVDGRNFVHATNFLIDAGVGLGVLAGDLADLNGDGNLDFVVVISGGQAGFGVFFGNGTGSLSYNANAFQTVPGMITQVPVIADFNGDNKLDVALGTYQFSGADDSSQVRIYQGLGNGKFSLGQTLIRDKNESNGQLYLHDINGDGVLDILDPSFDGNVGPVLRFYLGSLGGQFTVSPELTIPLGYSVAQLVVGDFTGDGFDDIAVSKKTNNINELVTTIPIFAGDGTGHFAEPQFVETGALWPHTLVLIPIAGSIDAGAFAISQPVLSVPAGAINLAAATLFQRPVAVNPRPLLAAYSNDPIALAVSDAPLHGTVTIQTQGTPGNLNDDTFVYTPAAGYSGSDSFTYLAADGRGGTAIGSVTITVAPPNQNPVLTMSPGALNYFNLGDDLYLGLDAILTDADSVDFQGGKLTIEITSGFDPDLDYLTLNSTGTGPGQIETEDVGAINVYYSGVLIGQYTREYNQPLVFSLTKTAATPAAIQAVLRQLIYFNLDAERTVASEKTVVMTLTDGDGGVASVSRTILLPAMGSNLAPVIATTSGTAFYTAGSAAIVIDDAATVSDSDSPSFGAGNLTIVFSPKISLDDRLAIRHVGTSAGQINLSGNTVKFGSTVIGTYSGGFVDSSPLVISFNSNATPAITQALLRQITFANITSDPGAGSRDIRITVNDGLGGVSTPTFRSITVVDSNQNPEIILSAGTTQYAGNQTPVIVDADASIFDIDAVDFAFGSLSVEFLSGHSTADRLGILSGGTGSGQINLSGNMVRDGLTVIGTYSGGFLNSTALVISFNGNAFVDVAETLVRNITFHVASDSPTTSNRVIRFVLNDGQQGVSQPADKSITVGSPVGGGAPIVQLPGPTVTYSKLAAAIAIDSQTVVIGPSQGSGTVGGGTLTISINDVNTGKLKFDVFNLSALNNIGVARETQLISGRWVAVFDLNSDTTAQDVRNALRSVTFQTSKKGLKFTTRTVQIQLSDSEGDASTKVVKTINVSRKRVR